MQRTNAGSAATVPKQSASSFPEAVAGPEVGSSRLQALIELIQSIGAALNVDDIAGLVLPGALRIIPTAEAGKLLLYDKSVGRLIVQDMIGMSPDTYRLELEPGEGMSGVALATQKPAIFNNPRAVMATLQGKRVSELVGTMRAMDLAKSGLAAPIIYHGEPIGVLTVQSLHHANAFDEFDLRLIDGLAQAAASAIVHTRVFEAEHAMRASIEALHAEVTRQRDELQRRLAVQHALANVTREGPTFALLAGQLRALVEGAATIVDPLYRIRASDPALSREHLLEGSGATRIRDALRRAARTRGTQALAGSDGHSLVVTPVLSGHELLGFVILELPERDADALDVWTVESAALVSVIPFMAERASEETEAKRLDLALASLLEGGAERSQRSGLPGVELPLVMAVGGFVGPGAASVTESELILLLRATRESTAAGRPGPIVTLHRRHVVVLSGLESQGRVPELLLARLETVAARLHAVDAHWEISFALSDRIDSFGAVAAAFNEARLALDVRRSIGRDSAVFTIASLGAYRFILQATTATQALAFSDSVLGPVALYDASQGTQLLHTLHVYVLNGMSVKRTATTLKVHPHTVQYRLRCLEDLTSLELARSEDRLTLELAARLRDLARA